MTTKRFGLACVLVAIFAASALAQTASPNQTLADAVKTATDAKSTSAALEASAKLEASTTHDALWAANARNYAVLLAKSGKLSDAEAWVKSAAGTIPADMEDYAKSARVSAFSGAAYDVAKLDPDPARRVDLARVGLGLDPKSWGNFDVLYSALVASGKPDDALQACLDYAGKAMSMEGMRSRRMDLLSSIKRADALKAESVEYLKVATDPIGAARALANVLPADDSSLCVGLSAQQVLDGVKLMLRAKDAKVNGAVLLAIANQLTKGGDTRPLRVSDEAKALSVTLKDAPLAKYLSPLLTGDYTAAIKESYAQAKASASDSFYTAWVNATAGAIRARDQYYNGAAIDFVKFINGAAEVNPIAGVLGQ